MPSLPIYVQVTERKRPRHLRSVINQALKTGNMATARYFHLRFVPDRFTISHSFKAQYKPRKRSYTSRKKKVHGHSNPLQYSGKAKIFARVARVTGTSKSAKLRYPELRVFNLKHPNSQINMREEFERVLPSEVVHLVNVIDTTVDAAIHAAGDDPRITYAK